MDGIEAMQRLTEIKMKDRHKPLLQKVVINNAHSFDNKRVNCVNDSDVKPTKMSVIDEEEEYNS